MRFGWVILVACLLSGSHGHGGKIEDRLTDSKIRVTSELFPGAPISHCFKNRSDKENNKLKVIIGEVNDTSKESVDKMISEITQTGENSQGSIEPGLVVVETPLRHDNIDLNESIRHQNIRL